MPLAIVISGVVQNIDSRAEWIETAGLEPQPQVGWSYDGNTFSPPVSTDNPTVVVGVVAGKVHDVRYTNSKIVLVDVTGLQPQPEPGWTYDGAVFKQPASLTNRTVLSARIQSAISANANFLALGTPTTAQVVAQVALLTREVNALIRLFLNALDSTDGT